MRFSRAPLNSLESVSGIVIAADVKVYCAGVRQSSPNFDNADGLVVAFTAIGTKAWRRSYNGPLSRFDEWSAIAAGTDGSIFV